MTEVLICEDFHFLQDFFLLYILDLFYLELERFKTKESLFLTRAPKFGLIEFFIANLNLFLVK